jgi:hypothetical protein
MIYILATWISAMRPRPIRIEICPVLPLFSHFDASTIFDFISFDNLAAFIGVMKMASPFNAFSTDAIQFEEADSELIGRRSLFQKKSVKVSLIHMG